jgi:phage baseplate assembly protein W
MLQTKQTYVDIPFFLSRNTFTNDLNKIKDLSAIRQSLKNIILTNRGERFFDNRFGCDIYSSLFENYTMEMSVELQTRIAVNIGTYESRVSVNDVKIVNTFAENKIDVIVDFSIPDTGIRDIITIPITRDR